MDGPQLLTVAAMATAAVGLLIWFLLTKRLVARMQSDAQARIDALRQQSEQEIKVQRREAELGLKEELLQLRSEAEAEHGARRSELDDEQRRLDRRGQELEAREKTLESREQSQAEAEDPAQRDPPRG